jgi:hypothetical protein
LDEDGYLLGSMSTLTQLKSLILHFSLRAPEYGVILQLPSLQCLSLGVRDTAAQFSSLSPKSPYLTKLIIEGDVESVTPTPSLYMSLET